MKDLLKEIADKFYLEAPEDEKGLIPTELVNRIRVALGMEALSKEVPLPDELAKLVAKFDLHPKIIALVKRGILVFLHEYGGKECPQLKFYAPKLNDKEKSLDFIWHMTDPEKWDRDERFFTEWDVENGPSEEAWEPDYSWTPSEDEPCEMTAAEVLEANIDGFINWVEEQIDEA